MARDNDNNLPAPGETGTTPLPPSIGEAFSAVACRMDRERFPRICALEPGAATKGLEMIIYQAYIYLGHRADSALVRDMASMLYSEIMTERRLETRNLSLDECRYAVRNAILEGDEFTQVNVRNVYRALADYIRGEGRKAQEEAERRRKLGLGPLDTMQSVYAAELVRNMGTGTNRQTKKYKL